MDNSMDLREKEYLKLRIACETLKKISSVNSKLDIYISELRSSIKQNERQKSFNKINDF